MKSLLLVLLASVSMGASAADAPSLAGSWKVHNSIAGNESDMDCSFTQTDNQLSGSCKSEQGTVTISGKVDNQKVNWTYKSEYNGSPITLSYAGSVDSNNKMRGTVTVEEYSVEGDFTAVQSK